MILSDIAAFNLCMQINLKEALNTTSMHIIYIQKKVFRLGLRRTDLIN